MAGDVEGVIAFGLAQSEEKLREITAMICSGLPDDSPCKAVWSCEAENLVRIEVSNDVAGFRQKFIRQAGGLVVDQSLLVLHSQYHRRGHAKRLMRNLLILYDGLGITYASTFANHNNGGYTWAQFGARPIDPALQRSQLRRLVDLRIRTGEIDDIYREEILRVIATSSDEELMESVAELQGGDGVDIGRVLLLPHAWEAYWDLSCPKFRARIREVLQ